MIPLQRRLELNWETHKRLANKLAKFIAEHSPLIEGTSNWVHVQAETKLLDAMASLLNKENEAGVYLIEEMLIWRETSNFFSKYIDKLYAYRDWIEQKVSPVEYPVEDIDAEYRKRLDNQA